MTMAIDQQQRHHLSGMPLDHMPYSGAPQFSNPWATASQAPSSAMYPTAAPFGSYMPKAEPPRTMSLPYTSAPGSAHYAPVSLPGPPDMMNPPPSAGPYDHPSAYSAAPPHSATYAPHSATFAPPHFHQSPTEASRPSAGLSGPPPPTAAFGEALDGARGMVAMSQTDITPRNIYGPRGDRGSTDSYGFPPPPHSAHSSISSASSYPAYFGGSVDSSATDYSSAAESIDSLGSRTLPRPTGLMGASLPPVQQSMMGSFNSKVSSSTQKKHKCKVCDKRFTRPSSLQTHMYSHTGEKPFACEVPGCGRNFSVVSNLRRHRKVHKDSRVGDDNDGGSPEGSWASSSRD